jgi:hypothetical protein
MIDGNKKKIKVVKPLNKPTTPMGEFTTFDEPVDTVRKSKIPAALAERNNDNMKNMAM